MGLIYHGCMTKNADGTNKLIGSGDKCVTSTAQCFWKYPQDVRSGVKTHSQLIKQPTVSTEDCNYHFQNKERIQQWISGTEKRATKTSDQLSVLPIKIFSEETIVDFLKSTH